MEEREKTWYEAESWYAPLKKEVPQELPKQETKKKNGSWRWIAAILVLLLLIAGTSIAFGQASKAAAPIINEGGTHRQEAEENPMPDDFDSFFASYFTATESTAANVKIAKYDGKASFQLSLNAFGSELYSLQELYENCSKSVVGISGYQGTQVGYSWGTGIILSSDGYILTNTHVVDECDRCEVTLYDDSVYEALLVGADSISDIAVLKIEADGLQAAVFGDSAQLCIGDPVAAIGNPLGETFRMTVTDGIISAIDRDITYNGRSMTLLQTNTALNEGNSGGPLFNMFGQVIGITNMKMMSSYSSIEGIGFAIPSATVESVVNSLCADGVVSGRTSIGITVGSVPQVAADYYDLPSGLYVSSVMEKSDAAAKGVQAGDIITAVNGIAVETTQDVAVIKDALKVGDTIILSIWRNGEVFDLEVMLVDTNSLY